VLSNGVEFTVYADSGIGYGIGAVSAHETAHQILPMNMMDCVSNCDAPDVYEAAVSDGANHAWFFTDAAKEGTKRCGHSGSRLLGSRQWQAWENTCWVKQNEFEKAPQLTLAVAI
jgi:hypothetical protein